MNPTNTPLHAAAMLEVKQDGRPPNHRPQTASHATNRAYSVKSNRPLRRTRPCRFGSKNQACLDRGLRIPNFQSGQTPLPDGLKADRSICALVLTHKNELLEEPILVCMRRPGAVSRPVVIGKLQNITGSTTTNSTSLGQASPHLNAL